MYKIYCGKELLCDSRIDELVLIEPELILVANGAGSLSFTLPPDHPRYDLIKRRKSVVSVYRDQEADPIFQGICTEETVDFLKQKRIVCEGELTYLNDSILRPAQHKGVTVHELLKRYLNEHNAQVDEYKQFELGTVTVTDPNNYITCYTNMNSTLTEIKEDLLDDLGGYMRVRWQNGKRYLDYLSDSPRTNEQKIELGVNLLDYTSNIDDTDIATVIIPLGDTLEEKVIEGLDTRLDIKSVNNGLDYLESSEAINAYGRITKTVVWDGVSSPSILKSKGQKYLNEIQFENVMIEAKAVDLSLISDRFQSFHVLDKVIVVSRTHGMNKAFVLTEKHMYLNSPENDVYVLGTKQKVSLSARNNAAKEDIKKWIENLPTSNWVVQAIEQATSMITGVEGGYVILNRNKETGEPFELLVMDTDDISTAKNVWRWNQNGFGHSSDGYGGPYGTAITMDGKIVADYITSGTMFADRIKGGTLTLGGADNVNGTIYVKNSEGKVLITLDKNGITLSNNQKIKYGDLSGAPTIPSKTSDLKNDAEFIDSSTSTVIAENAIKTAEISCSQLHGGTITLGGSNTTHADLILYNSDDKMIGEWDEYGLYARSRNIEYSEFSNYMDIVREMSKNNMSIDFADLKFVKNNVLYKITQGVLRVYLILDDTSKIENFTLTVSEYTAIDNGSQVETVEYPCSVSINKVKSCYEYLNKSDEEYYFLELNPNAYFIDIDLSDLANRNLSVKHARLSVIKNNSFSKGTYHIAGIKFVDVIYSDGTKTPTTFIRNNINKHAKNFLIDTLQDKMGLGAMELHKDRIVMYEDSAMVGYTPKYHASGKDVAEWNEDFILNLQRFKHKSLYGNVSSTSGAKTLYINSEGEIISSSSSKRYKEDITYDISPCNVRNLYNLHPARFHYKHIYGGGDMELGFIAEDVAAIFPEAVMYNNSGLIESWNERKMIPALLALIQEQNERIKKLEGKVLKDGEC